MNCIGVRRAESRRAGFFGPAEITFSDRTWRRKRKRAGEAAKTVAAGSEGKGVERQRGSCIPGSASVADGPAVPTPAMLLELNSSKQCLRSS